MEETARILKYGSNILHHGLANALHTLTLEQNSEEIRLLLNVFKNEFALYLICRTIGLASQCLNVTHQLGQSLIQNFHQQLINSIVMPEKGDVSNLSAVRDVLD